MLGNVFYQNKAAFVGKRFLSNTKQIVAYHLVERSLTPNDFLYKGKEAVALVLHFAIILSYSTIQG